MPKPHGTPRPDRVSGGKLEGQSFWKFFWKFASLGDFTFQKFPRKFASLGP